MKKRAEGRNGYAAAFLYALERNAKYVPIAAQWLLGTYGPNGYWVKKYSERLADPEFFKGGQKHLADVYYGIDTQKMIAFDWVHDGLSAQDRQTILRGLLTCARYRIRAMDRWTQTPNLVFKPTYVVALTALVTRDKQCLEWGFRRTKPWGPHIGGYFTALNHMLYDGGAWHESPIYPIAHLDLILSARMSRYLGLADGQDWFSHKLPGGGSPRGLMDYYLDTAYPIEQVGDVRRVRVANYGDGSTNGNGDLFLICTDTGDKKRNILVHQPLTAAYNVSGDPRYAAFLAMLPDYQPSLWENRPLVTGAAFPPAPSKIWPRYGLAMLRSDQSRLYWTSGEALAVFQIMSQGYGHDHRDKFSITLHGAGRLFYPDYNAIQYENMAIGWTRNSVAHNTLLVDEQDTRNAEPTEIRHDFTSDVQFLATSATGVFERVDQTRALVLTREYLLDIFHAASPIPHTYDYLLHSFGKAQPVAPKSYRPSDLMKRRYWLVDNQRTSNTSDTWSLDFVLDDEPATRLRLTMAAEPGTNITLGNWGEELASLAEQRHKGVAMDRLSMLAVRRSGVRQTTFVASHEPTKKDRTPRITKVTKIAERHEGVLVRVDATDFTDYVAVRFGPTLTVARNAGLEVAPSETRSRNREISVPSGAQDSRILASSATREARATSRDADKEAPGGRTANPPNGPRLQVTFESPAHFASVESHGYLRVKRNGEIVGRGGWLGFRLPIDRKVTRLTAVASHSAAPWDPAVPSGVRNVTITATETISGISGSATFQWTVVNVPVWTRVGVWNATSTTAFVKTGRWESWPSGSRETQNSDWRSACHRLVNACRDSFVFRFTVQEESLNTH